LGFDPLRPRSEMDEAFSSHAFSCQYHLRERPGSFLVGTESSSDRVSCQYRLRERVGSFLVSTASGSDRGFILFLTASAPSMFFCPGMFLRKTMHFAYLVNCNANSLIHPHTRFTDQKKNSVIGLNRCIKYSCGIIKEYFSTHDKDYSRI
jgi:hypothetical protein